MRWSSRPSRISSKSWSASGPYWAGRRHQHVVNWASNPGRSSPARRDRRHRRLRCAFAPTFGRRRPSRSGLRPTRMTSAPPRGRARGLEADPGAAAEQDNGLPAELGLAGASALRWFRWPLVPLDSRAPISPRARTQARAWCGTLIGMPWFRAFTAPVVARCETNTARSRVSRAVLLGLLTRRDRCAGRLVQGVAEVHDRPVGGSRAPPRSPPMSKT